MSSNVFFHYLWLSFIVTKLKSLFFISGEVFYTRRGGWIATGVIFFAIAPILLCIVCALYRYRKRARQADPQWKMSLPRSRASSRSNLRNLNGDGSEADTDTLKKSRSYEKVYRTHEPLEGKPNIEFPEKKWDLDEEDLDVTSSENGAEFAQGKIARDINYISTVGGNDDVDAQDRQTGRRTQRIQLQNQPPPIHEESYRSPPVESPSSSYSPTYSFGQSPVLSDGSPVLTQTVGLPTSLPNRSTDV